EMEAWWQVDLGAVYTLKEVKIFNRTSCCGGRIKNFMVFMSPYPIASKATVAQLTNDANVIAVNGPNANKTTYELALAEGVAGRYVRIQLQDSDYLHMQEVEVYGCDEEDPLGIPQNLQASNITFTSVNLNWEGVGGAEKYNVYQDGVKVKEVTNTNTQITGLSQDTEYSFRVAAVRGSETSPKSNTETIRTLKEDDPTPPGNCESPTNLALNRPASQSSTYGNGAAGLAVDGNSTGTTPWGSTPNLQHTDKDGEPWWQVDLGDTYQIKEIKITNRTDCCQSRLKNFMVFSSTTPFPTNASIAELEGMAGIHQINQTPAVQADISFTQEHVGRYVRIQLRQSNNSLHMSEVEIFGCSQEVGSDPLGTPQNLQATNITTTSVDLSWDEVNEAERYLVYQDGVQVREVTGLATRITGLSPDTDYSFQVAAVRGEETSAKSIARNIRTSAEVILTPPPTCDTPVNLALNKVATQSSTKGNGVAAFAVDGVMSGSSPWGTSANIQHTEEDGEPWWQVDLGAVAQIKEIKITNRTSCCQERLTNFVVFTSSTPFPENASIAQLEALASVRAISHAGTVAASISFSEEHEGRYVRIQLRQTTKPLHLSEVEVFGCLGIPGPPTPPKGKMLQELVDLSRTYEGTVDQVFTSDDKNYIHTINHQEANSSAAEDNWENITYFDGIGRPIQSVEAQASFEGVDMVTPIVYDKYGRQDISYLPYTHMGSPIAGRYKDNWEAKQPGFYGGLASISGSKDKPYALTQFEASPLNRVIEQGAPGTDWQPSANPGSQNGGEHTVITEYLSNSSGVHGFIPENLNTSGKISRKKNYYSANSLNLVRSVDENGAETETATDKQGRLIYKSVQIKASSATKRWDSNDYATTYYVYDAFGNVRFVIQPEGWKTARTSGISTTIRDDYCFEYVYDARQRVIRKKVPGADWVEMVYDKLDRVVATQDGNLRGKGQWLVTKYDKLGRPVLTGIVSGVGLRQNLQDLVNGNGSLFESYNGNGYTNAINPIIDNDKFHSVTFYDQYGFAGDNYSFKAESTFGFLARPTGTTVDYIPAESSQGRVTGIRVYILDKELDMPDYLQTVTYYDKYGREIQTIAQNHLDQLDIVGNRYSFTGEMLESVQLHNSGSLAGEERIHKAYLYDHRSRLL
ncbi:MAG: discoidin domain-containing protein, partial [Bacteroidota bacterium]